MSTQSGGTPAWLFSFVDLAFLLVIAMTQLATEPGPDFGEIAVPRIRAEATDDMPSHTTVRWQLRIHPPGHAGEAPFELTRSSGEQPPVATAERLTADTIRVRLAALRDERADKPLLAPHADSRSQDLLDAVELIEEGWPSRRRATVARVFAE